MVFRSSSEYFAGRAVECRAAVEGAPDIGTALANADLAERYDRYAAEARRLEAEAIGPKDR